ncbi:MULTISPECIES: DUF4328 domain-containing protein [unclassified Streptomyces]|uniref:DUF4328 domain-containing protein n=1 Tax=unclassified Streptomyces TaxID=2593676 RepID=UPI003318B475
MLRNPQGLATAVVTLLGLNVLFDLLLGVSEVMTLADPGGPTSLFADASLVQLGVGDLVVYLATVVLFVIWFYRVRLNANVWAFDRQSRTAGWAIGSWFIPIANLWIPRQIAVDVWRASRRDPSAADGPGELTLLNCWWTFFVVGDIVDRVATRLYGRAETTDALATAAAWSLAGYLLTIVAAVLAILFVRRLTSMQHAKATGMLSAA